MLTAILHRFLRRRAAKSESGQAMLIVIAALALMATIPLVVITTTDNQLPLTTQNLDWNAAYEAAQAGLNDYIQNLDANQSYAEYSKTNQPSPSNSAFSGWEQVGGTSNPSQWFEYAPSVSNGSVTLKVSGKAGSTLTSPLDVVRNFTYSLVPQSTLDYIYWTNYEKIDPNLPNPPGAGGISGSCAFYQGQSGNDQCDIVFASADTLDGPVFSNDGFYMCGNPTFGSTVQSADSYMSSPYWSSYSGCGTSSPNFQDGAPTLASNQPVPTTGAALAPAQQLGCTITDSGSGVTFALNGSTLTWSGGSLGTSGNSTTACGGSTGGGTVTFSSLKSAIFYVTGNINVSGTMTGFLTLVASGNIDITGNITYPSANKTTVNGVDYDSHDALGLVTNNFIDVTPTSSTEIDAAMLAAGGSFYANDYNSQNCSGGVSTCPTLTIIGALAQDYRGPVGRSGYTAQGFQKNYIYDESLQTLWPPFFLPPSGATWSPTSYDEIQPGVANEAVAGS